MSEETTEAPESVEEQPKRRGRPPGSKNKPKTTTDEPQAVQTPKKRPNHADIAQVAIDAVLAMDYEWKAQDFRSLVLSGMNYTRNFGAYWAEKTRKNA